MYAIIWFTNKFGSTIRKTFEDEESCNAEIARLREKRMSFHVEYGEDA